MSHQAAAGRIKPPPPLTWHGITFYGSVDVGAGYISHGAPLDATYGTGLPFTLQKFSNKPIFSDFNNGLSMSKIGLAIQEPITKDLSFVGKFETTFQPLSLRLTNGPASLIANNGKPLAGYVEAGDSSRAGMVASQAYLGLSSKKLGTLTFGRQYSLIMQDMYAYDPMGRSKAFSPIGYSGLAAGGGDTEDAREGDSIKYAVGYGPAHLAVMHQFHSAGDIPGDETEFGVGADLKNGLSFDATWSHITDAVDDASLTYAQNLLYPGTLAATVSDNTTWTLMGKYTRGHFRIYGGYEHIEYSNPSNPVADNTMSLGGYTLSYVDNTAYTTPRSLQIAWTGLKWYVTPRLQLTGAYYIYWENSNAANGGCSNASSPSCSGSMQEVSLMGDYQLSRRWDVYAGIQSSWVMNGYASGYLQTSEFSPLAGIRFNF
jgi:predicted porin